MQAVLSKLINEHKASYSEVSTRTGIGMDVLRNIQNNRGFTASTARLNALNDYLQKLESGMTDNEMDAKELALLRENHNALARDFEKIDKEYRTLLEDLYKRNKALEKKNKDLEKRISALESDGG